MRAVDPKKINNIADVAGAFKRKVKNVTLNLDTAVFEVKNAKNEVVKEIVPEKGMDAAYIVNYTTKDDTFQLASNLLLETRNQIIHNSAEFETEFAEKQDELLKTISLWHESNPGASRRELSIKIGHLQNDLAYIENRLRSSQYKYRGAIELQNIKRRTFIPASNDDRVVQFPVFKINAYQTSALQRIIV